MSGTAVAIGVMGGVAIGLVGFWLTAVLVRRSDGSRSTTTLAIMAMVSVSILVFPLVLLIIAAIG
jgi:hypothetical protein